MSHFWACLIAICISPCLAYQSLLDFGGREGDSSNEAGFANSFAMEQAFQAANSSSDRLVLIPSGMTFYIFDVNIYNISNVTLQIDGELYASNNITAWPTSVGHTLAVLYVSGSDHFKIQGNGTFDGQGYEWWWYVIITTVDQRPHLFVCEECINMEISDKVHFRNSPQFHLKLDDILNVYIHDISIIVDVDDQTELLQRHGHWDHLRGLPTFPLNTDGIDPAGKNVTIERVVISNFDDAVAVKPMTQTGKYSSCSENMLIRNSVVYWGVGLTIGSVPPSTDVNCVRNITFENITSHHPIKAIYIKTNPGTEGTGIIDSITYRNIRANGSLWYPIWIGPQQQKQPGTAGTGCSFEFPIVPECPTQPRVPITNVLIQNAYFENSLTMPGVLLCNETVPCTGIVFDNVVSEGEFVVQDNYYCENVVGKWINTKPTPECNNTLY